MKGKEIYLPGKAEIVEVVDMTADIKLFKIKYDRPFHYQHGQFLMLSLWGKGEVPISITSTCGLHEYREHFEGSAPYIELCIRRVGYITSAMHQLKPPFEIGLRGPFGNTFPIEDAKNKDVLFVAGGLGIAPLRPLITTVMNRKKHFRRVALIYGSRNPSEILFKDDIDSWQKKGLHIILTIDRKDRGWDGNVGLVTEYLNKPRISFKNARAFICGPPIMIKATMNSLARMGMNENNIFTSLEAHMKCGVGKCGHCYTGGKYICTDGPIFSYADIKRTHILQPCQI